ncbi:hypothetical protein [Pontiella sulfatireligans]|nr:hypothetical protein [Pontiella sulfatireligans]
MSDRYRLNYYVLAGAVGTAGTARPTEMETLAMVHMPGLDALRPEIVKKS